jgi:hypothetical protein
VKVVTVVAALRCAVGGALIGLPDMATGGDAERRVLVRTIGLRDVVLGAATLRDPGRGSTPAGRVLVGAGLANDVGDLLLALASHRELGRRGTLIAALTPLPFVVAGARALLRDHSRDHL